jgi:hypothetical protein
VFCPPTTGELEGYGEVTIADDIAVRRGPINREIARLDGGWVCRISEIDCEPVGAVPTAARPQVVLVTVPPGGGVGPSYSSALAKKVKPVPPAAANAIPLNNRVAVCCSRAVLRLPVAVQVPVAGL